MRSRLHVRPEAVMALLWQVNVVPRPVLTKALKYVGATEDKILLVEDHDESQLDEPLRAGEHMAYVLRFTGKFKEIADHHIDWCTQQGRTCKAHLHTAPCPSSCALQV